MSLAFAQQQTWRQVSQGLLHFSCLPLPTSQGHSTLKDLAREAGQAGF